MNNKLGEIKIADDINLENYEKTSIDSFGKDMLYRMGWKDNTPIRKDGPLKPIEFKPRNSGLGLGADPTSEKKKDDKNLKSKTNLYGTKVRITGGKHKGLKGKLVDKNIEDLQIFLNENKFANVELKLNKQIIKIESQFIKIRSHQEKKDCKNYEGEKPKFNSKTSKNKSRSRSRSRHKEEKILKKPKNKLSWVIPHIIVRVISKNSKYYNCKGVIQDINDLFTFSLVMMDDKTLHTEFTEDDIETVIPKINEDVIILSGKHKSEKAKLLLRDKKSNKVSVQLYSDLSIVNLTQDDVAAHSYI
jgi:ribosomal protein L24